MQTLQLLQQNILLPPPPLWHMNMMSIDDERVAIHNNDFVDKPTHTDVLLGRGVGTNRHAGNTNFRDIVAQWIVSIRLSA